MTVTLKIEDIQAQIDVIFKQRVAQMVAIGEKVLYVLQHEIVKWTRVRTQ